MADYKTKYYRPKQKEIENTKASKQEKSAVTPTLELKQALKNAGEGVMHSGMGSPKVEISEVTGAK